MGIGLHKQYASKRKSVKKLLINVYTLMFTCRFPGLGGIRFLYLLRDLSEFWVAKPLPPLFNAIAISQFRLLEEADHTDDSKMLAKRFQALSANLNRGHDLMSHCWPMLADLSITDYVP